MSSVVLFRRKFFRYNNNIQHCFSLQRKSRLIRIVLDRPWANGLNRLLAERRGLKKGQLAEIAVDRDGKPMRPGTISAVINSDKAPEIPTLQRLAGAFTAYDRRLDINAPEVELWEFFVTDEQAQALRARAEKTRSESTDETLLKRGAEMFAQFLKQQQAQAVPVAPAVVEPPKKKRHA